MAETIASPSQLFPAAGVRSDNGHMAFTLFKAEVA